MKKLFSIDLILLRRANPDGTMPLPERTVGFSGTADLSGIGSTTAPLKIKLNGGPTEEKTIDFTAAANPAAVTVDEMVTALQAAAFTDVTFSKEAETGRLLIVADNAEPGNRRIAGPNKNPVQFMQVHSELANLMLIGNGGGTKILTDADLGGASDDVNLQDEEEVEIESGRAVLSSVVFPAKVTGRGVSVTYNGVDLERLFTMIGGTYDSTNQTYEDPQSDDVPPRITVETYQRKYAEGTNGFDVFTSVERILYKSGSSVPASRTRDAKAFTTVPFDMSFQEYTNAAGEKEGAAFVEEISEADYKALNLDDL